MANPKPNSIGIVWSLFLKPEEEEKLIKILTAKKLPPNANGIKELVLSEKVVELTPEMETLIHAGLSMAGNMIKKRVGL